MQRGDGTALIARIEAEEALWYAPIHLHGDLEPADVYYVAGYPYVWIGLDIATAANRRLWRSG